MKTYIIAKTKSKKLICFTDSFECFKNLKNIIAWRQIDAICLKHAFIKFNQ